MNMTCDMSMSNNSITSAVPLLRYFWEYPVEWLGSIDHYWAEHVRNAWILWGRINLSRRVKQFMRRAFSNNLCIHSTDDTFQFGILEALIEGEEVPVMKCLCFPFRIQISKTMIIISRERTELWKQNGSIKNF